MVLKAVRASKLFYLLVLTGLFLGTATAASSINVTDQDKTIWLEQETDNILDGAYSCDSPDTPQIKLEAMDDSYEFQRINVSDGSFSLPLSSDSINENYGDWQIKLYCSWTNTGSADDTQQMSLTRFVPNLEEPSGTVDVYRGESFDLEISGAAPGLGSLTLKDDPDFYEAEFLDGTELELEGVMYSSNQNAELTATVPHDVDTGDHRLIATADYNTAKNAEVQGSGQTVHVRRPWTFQILNSNANNTLADREFSYDYLFSNTGNYRLKVRARNKGEDVNTLESEDFYVEVLENGDEVSQGEWVESSATSQSGGYSLKLSKRPGLDYGSYTFVVGLDRNSGTEIARFKVKKYVSFSGVVKDSTGRPVDVTIETRRDGVLDSFGTDNAGKYSQKLLPGKYNVTARFPGARLNLNEVEITGDLQGNNRIRYDQIPGKKLEGSGQEVNVLTAAAVSWGYPFEDATLSMNYNPGRVDFRNIKVFECRNWLFDTFECNSEFEEVELSSDRIYPTVGEVNFDVRPVNVTSTKKLLFNSYMMVKETVLQLDSISISSDRLPVNGDLTVSGTVTDNEGDGIQGASVEVMLLDGDQVVRNSTAETNDRGIFEADMSAPGDTGVYDLKVAGSRPPHTGFEKMIDQELTVFVEREISINPPDTVTLIPGQRTETDITISNNGQVDAKDVKVAIRGLNTDWYNFTTESWDTLPAKSSRTTTIEAKIPADYCGEDGRCRDYPQFRAEVTGVAADNGNSLNDIVTVQSVISGNPDSNQQQSSTREEEQEEPMSLPGSEVVNATGEFLASQSSLNMVLGLLVLFTMVLSAAIKKKKDGSGRELMSGAQPSTGQGSAARSGREVQKPDVSAKQSSPKTGQPPRVNAQKQENTGEQGRANQAPDQTQQNPGQKEAPADTEPTQENVEQTQQEESHGSEDQDSGKYSCGTCGESFDTASAKKLHEKTMH